MSALIGSETDAQLMSRKVSYSELILNRDGSIYHLGLHPTDIADIIFLVGDPDRVPLVSKYFDTIDIKKHKRELHTHTGTIGGVRLSVVSTGMGTENIDIVLNELDALANIDFVTKKPHKELKSLVIIRLGTSGAVQANIPIGSLVVSRRSVGFDNLLYFYDTKDVLDVPFSTALRDYLQMPTELNKPYVVTADTSLHDMFCSNEHYITGITGTNSGFYGPQSRQLRIPICASNWIDRVEHFSFEEQKITNFDMETAGIVGLSALMGHRSISVNSIIANRVEGTFAEDTASIIDFMIHTSIDVVVRTFGNTGM